MLSFITTIVLRMWPAILLAVNLQGLQDWGLAGLFTGSFLAATIIPASSDLMLVAALLAKWNPWGCFLAALTGNWLGSLTTYWLGRAGKWEWIERLFKVSRKKIEAQRKLVTKWGIYLALIVWVPVVGDLFCLALGFYRTPFWRTNWLILLGKALRYTAWMLLFAWKGDWLLNLIY